MAGTIVCDTIQDGAGNSTATDNAIYGSAKAWVYFNGGVGPTINGSYNVSSVIRNGTGDYTVNFTNSLSSTNYAAFCQTGFVATNSVNITTIPYAGVNTTNAVRLASYTNAVSGYDASYYSVAVFR